VVSAVHARKIETDTRPGKRRSTSDRLLEWRWRMRNTAAALALFSLGAGWLAGTPASADAGDVARDIRATADRLLAGGSEGPGEVQEPLRHLIEVAAGVGREGRLAAPVQAKIDSAAAQARRLSPLDERARAAVDEAYAALNQGRPFAFPKAVGSIEQAKGYGRGQVDRSLAALSAGRSEEAARELLGFVLLVITPMEAKP